LSLSNRCNQCLARKIREIPHKNTLFHTVAHFKGSQKHGQALLRSKNIVFFNEVKHLGKHDERLLEVNTENNEELRAEIECRFLNKHMCLHELHHGHGSQQTHKKFSAVLALCLLL
jgi:hypothetical protein